MRNNVVLSFVTLLQTESMRHENRRAAFRAWMDANGLKPADVARRSGIKPTTIYSYLAGKSQSLMGTREQIIADAFSTTVESIFTSRSEMRRDVGVWGKIGARAEVYPLTDYTETPMYEVALPPWVDPDQEYVAFEIEGLSMPPASPGFVVFFRKAEVDPDLLLNSACLVDLTDGRRLFKTLRRGYAPGRYNLESWDGSALIEDVSIVRALPFAGLTPGRQAR